jgi:hypothetical protein
MKRRAFLGAMAGMKLSLDCDHLLADVMKGMLVSFREASQASFSSLEDFEPRPDDVEEMDQQTGFLESTAKFSICLGGNRSGKTIAAAAKVARYVLETPPHRNNCPFWILGETFEQTCAVCWDEKLSHFIPPNRIYDIDWLKGKRKWPRAVLLKHPDNPDQIGWVIEFKSYDQGVERMQGRSIGGYWFNEECPLEVVKEVQVRAADYDAPGWADFTPIHIRDPLWSDLYDEPPPGWEFFHLNVFKNKTKSIQAWAERYFPGIPEEERLTRQKGVFASFHGMVFKEFDKKIHVIDQLPTRDGKPLAEWRRIRGIDFGWSNPTACLWICQDRDGRYYVYDEHYDSQKPIEYHAQCIKDREWNYRHPMYGQTYCDSEDPAAIHKLRDLTGSGSFVPVNKSLASIGKQVSLLRKLMMVQGDGKPQLFILKKCANLIREIRGYRWSEAPGKVGNQRNPQDYPVQWNDHAVDALRYALFFDSMGPLKAPQAVRRDWVPSAGIQVKLGRNGTNGHNGNGKH